MRVLVTGGAGYVGSHAVKLLRRAGHEPVILDNFSSGRRELLQSREVIEADLADAPALRRAFEHGAFEAVLHFASLIEVGESFADPQKYYRHNLVCGLNLLQAMLEAGVKKVIFSSSAAVYGAPRKTPVDETHPLEPANPYGRTKLFLEKILEDYDRAYGLKFISLRYFNAAGADPDGELGEMHDPETHLIPNILFTALGRKKSLDLFGTDFPTPDGTAVRDYVHVADLAQAHLLALEKLETSETSDCINLGAGRGYSVLEVVKKAEEVTGRAVVYTRRPPRRGDVPVLLASRERAESALGWKPALSDLESIIRTAWQWHSQAHAEKRGK
ncbi:MAG: UDP-glucose 4-epimerase GalE [Candidatus Aminicenantes bacterium RBG_13_62_12]|nr:MAG: UDP-glucose 4-epimerase GalE [Candidatus Aminicenantes bacterium RBG_13_62_12]